MPEHFRGDISGQRESESKNRQKDIDFIYTSLMEGDSAVLKDREARERRRNEVRAAEMRLMLEFAREEGIEPHDPRFEWDYIVIDRPPVTEHRLGRVLMEYHIDAKDRLRELYEERNELLNGDIVVRYSVKKKYAKPPEKLREPSWHPDNEWKDVIETIVAEKEVVLTASRQAVGKLNEERAEHARRAAEAEARYQAFLKLLRLQKKKMPLIFSTKDMELNPYLPLYNGIKEYVSADFFTRHTGPEYGFRILPQKEGESEYFVIEAYLKKSGYVEEAYHLV